MIPASPGTRPSAESTARKHGPRQAAAARPRVRRARGDAEEAQLEGFLCASQLVGRDFGLEALCEGLLAQVAEVVPSSQSALLLVRGGEEPLSLLARRGDGVSEDEAVWIAEAAGQVLRDGRPLRVDDAHRDPRCRSIRERSGRLRSVLLTPIADGAMRLGLLELGESRAAVYSAQDALRLGRLSEAASRWIRHAQAFAETESESRRLRHKLSARERERRDFGSDPRVDARRRAADRLLLHITEQVAEPTAAVLPNVEGAVEALAALREDLAGGAATAGDGRDAVLGELALRLSRVAEGARRLDRVSGLLGEAAQGRAAPVRMIDLAELIGDARRMVLRSAKPDLGIEMRVGELPLVRGHRLRILQMLVDLLACTAADAAGGGVVRIEAHRRAECVQIEVVGELLPPRGADPLDLYADAIRGRARGHELGAAMEIVEGHGGSISVECGEERAVIQVVLPVEGA